MFEKYFAQEPGKSRTEGHQTITVLNLVRPKFVCMFKVYINKVNVSGNPIPPPPSYAHTHARTCVRYS